MPFYGDKVIPTGRAGRPGPTGPTGSAYPDAPSDGTYYGRAPGAWIPTLPLSGGTLTGGITWPNVVASGPTDTSLHLRISTTYNTGICVTGNTLNYYGTPIRFYGGGTGSFQLGDTNFASRTIYFNDTGAFPYITWNPNNGTMHIYAQSGSSADMYWDSGGKSGFFSYGYGTYCVGELFVTDVGVRPYTTNFTNGNNWRWDGTWMYVRYDNSVEFPVAVACDERMKQDIAPSTFDALDTIRKIRLYQYRWLDQHIPGFVKYNPKAPLNPIGFVAQRLAEDFPYGAKVGSGKFKGAVMLGIAERHTMLATLCRAVQQLDDRVQALRNA